MSDTTQPHEPVPDATIVMPTPGAVEAPAEPQVRTPFEITKFVNRHAGLQLVGTKRSGMGYEQIADDALFDEMYSMLVAQYRMIASLAKGKDRVHSLWQREKRRADALAEELDRRKPETPEHRTPVQAVGVMTGGQLHSEKLIVDAEAHAERIVANAEALAARRAGAVLDVAEVPAKPEAGDLVAVATWYPQALQVRRNRVSAARAVVVVEERDLDELVGEQNDFARDLRLATAALTGEETIDVRETETIEKAS